MNISKPLYNVNMTADESRIAFDALDLLKAANDSDFTSSPHTDAAIADAISDIRACVFNHKPVSRSAMITLYSGIHLYLDAAADMLEVHPSESDRLTAARMGAALRGMF